MGERFGLLGESNFIANERGCRLIANDLHNEPTKNRCVHPLKAIVGGWLCLLLLLCGTLAAQPKWHQWFHGESDGGDSTGTCPIELLASGGIDIPSGLGLEQILTGQLLWEVPSPAPLPCTGFVVDAERNRGPPVSERS